jgi:diguanylate cyclase (GGDEF)-like protein/PAS domain S-box-containing protein
MELSDSLPRHILEETANAVVITDREGVILWINPAFVRLTGYPAEEAIGQTPRILKSGVYDESFYRQLWDTILKGDAWSGKITNRRKDGSLYIEQQTISPILNEKGEISFFVGIKQEIVEISQTDDLLLRQIDELSILQAVATASAEADSVQALIEWSVRAISGRLYRGIEFGVGLADEQAGAFQAYVSFPGRREKKVFPLSQGVTGHVFTTGQAVRLDDVRMESGYIAENPDMRSEICVPLKSGEHILGVLNAESTQVAAFDEADVRLMTAFAGQLAVAIEKVRLYQQAVRTAEQRAVLYRAAQEISTSLDLEEVYQAIHRAVAQLMPCEDLLIALLDEKREEIETAYLAEYDQRLPVTRFPATEGLSGHVISTRQSLKYDDFAADHPDVQTLIFGTDRSRSGVVVPLLVKGRAIGALSAQSYQPHAYTTDDQDILELLASHAAIAIENARLFAEVQQLATHDSLTNVYNRHHFFTLAKREVEIAHRYSQPLSMIIFDVDHFKRVNDTFGHTRGDQALQSIAQICRTHLRDMDILGRYGGEEFIILLSLTDERGAQAVAERLRKEIALADIETGSGPLTISLGVAQLNETCEDLEILVDHADQALYAAKEAGRNRVMIFSEQEPGGN